MTVDTNILIAYLNNETEVVGMLDDVFVSGATVFLPASVMIELLSFTKWSDRERTYVRLFLETGFYFVPIDHELSLLTAQICRQAGMKLPDATIAATALSTRTPLLTRNTRDFRNVTGLSVQTV